MTVSNSGENRSKLWFDAFALCAFDAVYGQGRQAAETAFQTLVRVAARRQA
jgi:hypothetical protein